MRESNFSIPGANKASVGITTALYDRRALDCTSTLPLMNSLNNLAYLTTSSARIRDILTVDGGIERLVCILKEGRPRPSGGNGNAMGLAGAAMSNKEMMECWKWNLAFQCVVNIGVRGSENVRTRVVEADMVPVIATVLDNYVKVIEKCRERVNQEERRTRDRHYDGRGGSSKYHSHHNHHHHHHHGRSVGGEGTERMRRQAPPPIEIPMPLRDDVPASSPLPAFSLSSPPERTTFSRGHRPQRTGLGDRTPSYHGPSRERERPNIGQPLATAIPSMESMADTTFGLRPVRDVDRLPSMLALPADPSSSRPDSPTTPNAPVNPPSDSLPLFRRVVGRRPSVRHQASMSQDSDEMDGDNDGDTVPNDSDTQPEPVVGINESSDLTMRDILEVDDDDRTIIDGESPVRVDQPTTGPEIDALHLARSAIESSLSTATNETPRPPTVVAATSLASMPPLPPLPVTATAGLGTIAAPAHAMQINPIARYAHERSASLGSGMITSMPRDEDVIMCLQLLAYVSKYCGLRTYFSKSHLVPRLKITTRELSLFDGGMSPSSLPPLDGPDPETLAPEYLEEENYALFPLIEKFTVRHHTPDMQYWAGVVMRNLCRKDDSRGGIRQCAFYACGKWEEYTRQFAKCRRCRRTKYCSKECQKKAWVWHRHWCVAAGGTSGGNQMDRSGREVDENRADAG